MTVKLLLQLMLHSNIRLLAAPHLGVLPAALACHASSSVAAVAHLLEPPEAPQPDYCAHCQLMSKAQAVAVAAYCAAAAAGSTWLCTAPCYQQKSVPLSTQERQPVTQWLHAAVLVALTASQMLHYHLLHQPACCFKSETSCIGRKGISRPCTTSLSAGGQQPPLSLP